MIIREVAAGNQQAFKTLFDLHWDAIYSVALAFTKSPALSEELVQDIFLKIWLKREELLQVSNFEGYLFIIARNHIFNALRKKVQEVPFVEEMERHFSEQSLADDLLLLKEADKLVKEAKELLPAQQKAVFELSRLEGLNHEQIAQQLQISKLTVKVHMRKALHTIRQYLQQHSGGLVLVLALYEVCRKK